jgi:hypothetical protein
MPPSLKNPDHRLAYTLVTIGVAVFAFERFGLSELRDQGVGFDPTVLGILAVAPVLLIVSGAVVYMVQRMRRR